MFFRKRESRRSNEKDWATEAADAIERLVDGIRTKAVVPLITVVRAIVYGSLAVVLGAAATVLVAILAVRLLDIYLHNISWMPDGVWVSHAVAGGIFVLIGLVLWSKRNAKSANAQQ